MYRDITTRKVDEACAGRRNVLRGFGAATDASHVTANGNDNVGVVGPCAARYVADERHDCRSNHQLRLCRPAGVTCCSYQYIA